MSKTKVLSKLVIVAIIISLVIALLCTVNMQPARAETNNELMTTQTVDDEGNVTYNVSNVKNYLEPAIAMRSSRAIEDKVEGLLKALQYSDEQIADMSHEQKMKFLNTEDAVVTSREATHPDYKEFESVHRNMYKLTIWSRAIRTGEKIETEDGIRQIFRLLGTVEYDRRVGNGYYYPLTRETDAMIFAWNGNTLLENDEKDKTTRFATMKCDTFNAWTNKYKSTGTNHMGNSRFLNEYAPIGGWGVRFNLPDNSLANTYGNFVLNGECSVAALGDFTFYLEYGHRTLAGVVSASITNGLPVLTINFNDGCDISKAPPLTAYTAKL